MPFVSRSILALCVGQIASMSWVFARSALSGLVFYFTAHQLPISSVEVWALVICVLFVVSRAKRESESRFNAWQVVGLLVVLACISIPVAFRDLPRTVALSSDPDQHAFWASQVYKLGIVPWDQGLTGVGPLGYPAGFAALNAIWMFFSGCSAVEIVTIQPMLQFLLATAACAAYAPILIGSVRLRSSAFREDSGNWAVVLAALAAIVLYWFALPYGLQAERFHGEGTARLSCSLLSALVLLSWVTPTNSLLTSKEQSIRLIVVSSSVALLATINPLSALLPGVFLGLIGLDYCWHKLRSRCKREALCTLLGCLMVIAIIFAGEPYLVTHAVRALGFSSTSATATTQVATSSPLSITLSTEHVFEWLSFRRIMSYLLAGTYIDNPIMQPIHLLFVVACTVWGLGAFRAVLRWIVALGVCGITAFAFVGLGVTGSIELPLYLVQPYVVQSVFQCGAILGFIALMPLLLKLFSLRSALITACISVVTICCFCVPTTPITARSGAFNMHIRGGYCGSIACLSEGDREAFLFIEQLGHRIQQQYPSLSYANAPKILILGIPADLGGERWVFPSGSARALPIISPLPVAFFYGRGHPDWTFENYQARLCQNLDLDWIKKRNIRYLFLAKNDPGCMKRRREVVRQGKVIFEHQGTRVIKLF
jgi:hypothetical protein